MPDPLAEIRRWIDLIECGRMEREEARRTIVVPTAELAVEVEAMAAAAGRHARGTATEGVAMTEDLPPVTFGIKVTKDVGHVHFDLFAGRNLGARGRCGSLVMRPEEFGAFLAALNPDTITSVEGHEWSLRLPLDAEAGRKAGEA